MPPSPVVRAPFPTFPNLAAMLNAAAGCPDPAMRFKEGGHWRRLSHPEVNARAAASARGLIALGVRPGERVAILGSTTHEWTLADLGTLLAGGVVVPVYHTNSPGECRYVIEHSGARAVFVEDETQLAKVREIRDECPDLEHVIVMESGARIYPDAIGLDELRARGAELPPEALAEATSGVGAGDVATIVYTSGTTGPPKGCTLTHGNVLSTIAMYEDQVQMAPGHQPVVFMFLPLAHVLARLVQFVALRVGGEIAYWSGDNAKLLSDLAEVAPTHFPSVPRVFEKVHTVALTKAEEGDAVRRAMFGWAIRQGTHMRELHEAGRTPTALDKLQHDVADRLVLSKVRGLFGGRVQSLLTGAAPLGKEVLEFFDACGLVILEGYGLTESTAAATLNTKEEHRYGTVGRPRPGVSLQIASDGEILVHGPMISPGYLHDEAATASTFGEDGWLRTGDLGQIDDDGYLAITGRKKDLIITSSGKNIAPSNIETELQETRWISHAVVFGDNKPYLVAVVTIDPTEAQALAEHAGVTGVEPGHLGEVEEIRDLLRESIDEVNAHYANIEQIKRFDVLERDLTQEDGELTPTLKVKRARVYDRYRDRFEALYRDAS